MSDNFGTKNTIFCSLYIKNDKIYRNSSKIVNWKKILTCTWFIGKNDAEVKVTQSCLTLCDPTKARILEWVAIPFSRGPFKPRDQTQFSLIASGFFASWATREAQSTVVGNLSLLQLIFPTQESNQSLLHCRQIVYQLSYQGRQNWC